MRSTLAMHGGSPEPDAKYLKPPPGSTSSSMTRDRRATYPPGGAQGASVHCHTPAGLHEAMTEFIESGPQGYEQFVLAVQGAPAFGGTGGQPAPALTAGLQTQNAEA